MKVEKKEDKFGDWVIFDLYISDSAINFQSKVRFLMQLVPSVCLSIYYLATSIMVFLISKFDDKYLSKEQFFLISFLLSILVSLSFIPFMIKQNLYMIIAPMIVFLMNSGIMKKFLSKNSN